MDMDKNTQTDFEKFFDTLNLEPGFANDQRVRGLFEKYFSVFDYLGQVGLANN